MKLKLSDTSYRLIGILAGVIGTAVFAAATVSTAGLVAKLSDVQFIRRGIDLLQANLGAVSALATAIFVLWLVRAMARYLDARMTPVEATRSQIDELGKAVALNERNVAVLRETLVSTPGNVVNLSVDDLEALTASVTQRTVQEVQYSIFDFVNGRLKQEFTQNTNLGNAALAFEAVVARLSRETVEVRQRANINLIIGTSVAAVGLIFLAYSVLTFQSSEHENWEQTLVRSLPRLTLVLIIELLGYFFLGLYRAATNEVKHYQNELTNVQMWAIGCMQVVQGGDQEQGKDMAKQLLRVERNFVLKKGESAASSPHTIDDTNNATGALHKLMDGLLRQSKQVKD